jgi:hypothetical protein
MTDWRDYQLSFELGGDVPSNYEWIELHQSDWAKPECVRYTDMHPAQNVAGLKWRPVVRRVT